MQTFFIRSRRVRAVVLAAGGLLAVTACKHKDHAVVMTPPSPPNEVLLSQDQVREMKIVSELVDEQNVDDTVLTSGKVTFDDQKVSHVYSPVAGKVVKITAQLGHHVNKGDPLVVIESPDIGVATSDVGKAKADLIAAEHDFKRQEDLFKAHAASQRDYETSEDNFRKAKAEMERASQKARLFQRGDVVGQTYTLRAELEGEVFMKSVSPGMEIAGQYGGGNPVELFTIGEPDVVWVLADVYEMDVPRVKVGSKVVVNVVSWPDRTFEGTVNWISAGLDKDTHATKVRCTFDNHDRALKPEMFATVRISVDEKKAVAIPRSAVLRLGDSVVVFLDRGRSPDGKQRFERVPVLVDEGEGSKWLTVGHGLEKGQKVVTSGAILLSGML